jgi:hypothetical protein
VHDSKCPAHIGRYTFAEPYHLSWPGKLDNVSSQAVCTEQALTTICFKSVAGGIPSGMAPFECLVKECHEEASLPETLVRQRARWVAAICQRWASNNRSSRIDQVDWSDYLFLHHGEGLAPAWYVSVSHKGFLSVTPS